MPKFEQSTKTLGGGLRQSMNETKNIEKLMDLMPIKEELQADGFVNANHQHDLLSLIKSDYH